MAAFAKATPLLNLQVPSPDGTRSTFETELESEVSFAANTDAVAQLAITPDDNITGDPQTIEVLLMSAAVNCTADLGTDRITAVGHGLSDFQAIIFEGTMPVPLVAGTPYYLRDTAVDDFKLSGTIGGAVIDLTSSVAAGLSFRTFGEIALSYTYPNEGPGVPVVMRGPGGPLDFSKVRALQCVFRAMNTAADALGMANVTLGDPAEPFQHLNALLSLNFTTGGAQTWPSATFILPNGLDYDTGFPLKVRFLEGLANVNGLLLINLLGN